MQGQVTTLFLPYFLNKTTLVAHRHQYLQPYCFFFETETQSYENNLNSNNEPTPDKPHPFDDEGEDLIDYLTTQLLFPAKCDYGDYTSTGASGVGEKLPMGGSLATKMPNLPLACIAETNYGKRKHKNKNLQMP